MAEEATPACAVARVDAVLYSRGPPRGWGEVAASLGIPVTWPPPSLLRKPNPPRPIGWRGPWPLISAPEIKFNPSPRHRVELAAVRPPTTSRPAIIFCTTLGASWHRSLCFFQYLHILYLHPLHFSHCSLLSLSNHEIQN